uniref:Uncharacterized protein n=1 Tax=Ananas comosus var. bracteatus TaxID=296719 RepID=A0A6V7QTL6_ANACO
MMKESWMEVLPPTPPHLASRFLSQSRGGAGRGGAWTQEENKAFEEALARLDRDDPDRWARVAAAIPGKTEGDVIAHYRSWRATSASSRPASSPPALRPRPLLRLHA